VADILRALNELHDDNFSHVLNAASFLLNNVTVRDIQTPILSHFEVDLDEGGPAPSEVEFDVLPPFAGG
jgi:hypothetical protein